MSVTTSLTFRRRAWYGWISISRMITRCALGIPITVRLNYQTRYTLGNRSPISIITELAVHFIGIHIAQYMLETDAK